MRKACKIRSLRAWNAENFAEDECIVPIFILQGKSIPLRRSLEADFDDLMGISDVVPASVGLPTFRNNLNERATERSFGDMGDAFAVGLDVEFEFFVLLDDMLFDVLDIDACVFNGNSLFAAGDFDP